MRKNIYLILAPWLEALSVVASLAPKRTYIPKDLGGVFYVPEGVLPRLPPLRYLRGCSYVTEKESQKL